MAERDRLGQLEYDMTRLAQQVAGLPVRIARTSPSPQKHVQIAMITEVAVSGTSPHYSTTFDLTFSIPVDVGHLVIVRAVLLDVGNEGTTGALTVLNPNGDTLDDLEFSAIDVRKEGLPKVGDVVRVWTSDGSYAKAGDASYVDGEYNSSKVIYCDTLNPTDYLRGLTTFNLSANQVVVHDADDSEVKWAERQDAGEVPDWVFDYPSDPIPTAGGDSVGEGYCIALDGGDPNVITHDAITPAAGISATDRNLAEMQFWVHFAGATTPADAKWRTAEDYIEAADDPQLLFNWGTHGGWKWETLQGWDYESEDVDLHLQLIVNVDNDPMMKSLTNRDTSKNQILWAKATTDEWRFEEANEVTVKSVTGVEVEITVDNKLKVKVNYAEIVVYGRTTGTTGSYDDTINLAETTVNSPTDIELNDNTTNLESVLPYVPKTMLVFANTDGSAAQFDDNVPISECPA